MDLADSAAAEAQALVRILVHSTYRENLETKGNVGISIERTLPCCHYANIANICCLSFAICHLPFATHSKMFLNESNLLEKHF